MTTTLQDLIAQQAALTKAMAEHEKPLLESAKDALTSGAAIALMADLATIRDQLPDSQAKVQLGNVLTVLNAVPQVLTQELARVSALAAPMVMPVPAPQDEAA